MKRPYEQIIESVCNQSSRKGIKPRLIVLHSTESSDLAGLTDIRGVINWFDNPQAQASAHVVIDKDGHSGQAVRDDAKAWHCMNFNSVSLGIEQIGRAAFGYAKWVTRRKQRRKVAQYIAYWSKKYGIPIQRGKVSGGQVVKAGVVTHRQLKAAGGGHHDPGAYPFALTLRLARRLKNVETL